MYTGVTNDLKRRLLFHRENTNLKRRAFTSKYKCFYLIYYECFSFVKDAIKREKQIKGWLRIKKEKLVDEFNPEWKFLNNEI